MIRTVDWPEKLAALVKSRAKMPFVWGTNDCCSLAADCIVAQTGVDVFAKLRGTYSDTASAAAVMKAAGGIEAFCDANLPRIPVAKAQRGDVCLVQIESRDTLTVCTGMHCCGPGAAGLVYLRTLTANAAWAIGRVG